MNLPNILTLIRIFMVPFLLIFMLVDSMQNFIIALIIFSIASFTDFLDGYIARKYNLITKLGKLIDPLADKILTISAFVALTYLNLINPWIVIAIISREFIVSGFRMVAASEGRVIAASYWGKLKTNFQIFTIIVILLSPYFDLINNYSLDDILAWITLALTIISAVDYIVKNIEVLKEN
ncbi:MAG: CDP-diacylglycerol--glycerol-3-phosphate 3-phosphatidyltransferase [Clostridiales bacterium]|nr:CDP-diacylglycerol--glycerol-3-phosphate 3-phosphatidyltransferase [Clostridiales bacterium]